MGKIKISKEGFYLIAGYLWLLILWTCYRLWGQNLLYQALPELPAALAEGVIKLLVYGLPVFLLVGEKRKMVLVSPPERWFRMNRETILVGLGGGAIFLLFFLLTNFLRNHAQGVVLQSPGIGEILSTVLFAGLTEELFFRGLLLNSLLSKFSFEKADIISAGAFLLIHFPTWLSSGTILPGEFLVNGASVFVTGLILGGVFEKTRNLWGPIFFHALYNLGVIFLTS